MGLDVFSVTEVISRVRVAIEDCGEFLSVEGEVSNLTRSTVGHWYFTLKDQESALQGALFKGNALKNPLVRRLKDGDKVIASGSLGVYGRRGTFQLIVTSLVPRGKGDLRSQFEALKKKLASEGLFDLDRKRLLPSYPGKVAVITAEGGAALQDFLKIYRIRSLWMDVILIPATVQGEQAPSSLRRALKRALDWGKADVIVLTRGGGSMEDLAAFNHEGLARDIFNCPVPVLSAVGHEVDFTIADYVADKRAETPSAAAQMLTEAQGFFLRRLSEARKILLFKIGEVLGEYKRRVLERSPLEMIQIMKDKLNHQQQRLAVGQRLFYGGEFFRFRERDLYLDELMRRAEIVLEGRIQRTHHRLDKNKGLLHAFDVRKVMDRGFSYLEDGAGPISSWEDFQKLSSGHRIMVHFAGGSGEVVKARHKKGEH